MKGLIIISLTPPPSKKGRAFVHNQYFVPGFIKVYPNSLWRRRWYDDAVDNNAYKLTLV